MTSKNIIIPESIGAPFEGGFYGNQYGQACFDEGVSSVHTLETAHARDLAAYQLTVENLTAERDQLVMLRAPDCTWAPENEDDDTWISTCGHIWSFTDGGPADNGCRYCHKCGGKILIGPDDIDAAIKGATT